MCLASVSDRSEFLDTGGKFRFYCTESDDMNSQITEQILSVDVSTSSGSSGSGHEITLFDLITQLALRKRLIAILTGISASIGIILAFALPAQYTSRSRIMPPQQTQSATGMLMSQLASSGPLSLAALSGSTGLGLKNPNEIYVGLLNSRPVADDIIRKFNLLDSYRSRDMTSARKTLAEFTTVTSEKSGMISIEVTDKDKKRAAGMANAYVEELRGLTGHLAVTEASQRALFYEQQLREAKDSLLKAETTFQQVQQTKGLVAPDAQARAMIAGMAELRARAASKQVELQALRSYSTDRNPEVEMAERELASIGTELARIEQRSHSSRVTDLGLQDVPSAGMDYLRAEHEVKYRQAMFDLLLRQYDAAKLDESKEAAVIQVVEPAIEPDRRSSPKRVLITLALSAVGFFFGCGIALFRWWSVRAQSDPFVASQLAELKHALLRN
jgi:tyrosine-protein kinase Etk/Wzc